MAPYYSVASTDNAWTSWTVTSAAASTGTAVWKVWTTTETITTDATDVAWTYWVDDSSSASASVYRYPSIAAPQPRLTAEQRNQIEIDRREQQRITQERAEAERKKTELALAKSKKLLMANLTAEQLRRFEQDECIPVDTAKGNKYLIRKNQRIVAYGKDGKPIEKWCVHPSDYVPAYDTMLAQLLHLLTDEPALRKIANISRVN